MKRDLLLEVQDDGITEVDYATFDDVVRWVEEKGHGTAMILALTHVVPAPSEEATPTEPT